MRTIAVTARKGGSGKTTVAVHMAIAAHLRGRKTLLADTDPQRSSSVVLKSRLGPGPAVVETSGPNLSALQLSAARSGTDVMVIDTPAGAEEELTYAAGLADLSLLVIRPTFLDFAAAVRPAELLRRQRRPALVILNQAPPPRAGAEAPMVKKAQEAARMMRLSVAPTILRARSAYQSVLESGCSAEELSAGTAASQEVAELWSFLERLTFGVARSEELCA
jgi:chromosome partitioning protein